MRKTWLLALVVAGFSVASAKTYSINIAQPSTVAGVKLKAGDYKLNVEGSKATFFRGREKTAAEANVTIENSPKKFDYTAVYLNQAGGKNQIEGIALGGTHMKLDFK